MRYLALLVAVGCSPLPKATLLVQKETTGYDAVQYIAPMQNDDKSSGIISLALSDDDRGRALAGRSFASNDYAFILAAGLESDSAASLVGFNLECDALRFHKQLTMQIGGRLCYYLRDGSGEFSLHGVIGAGLSF